MELISNVIKKSMNRATKCVKKGEKPEILSFFYYLCGINYYKVTIFLINL